jgi:hypothetical protein
MKTWFWNVLISIDQLANALFAPLLNITLNPQARFGDPDETLSSVFGKNVEVGSCRGCYWMCRVLHVLDPYHCPKSIERDEGDK